MYFKTSDIFTNTIDIAWPKYSKVWQLSAKREGMECIAKIRTYFVFWEVFSNCTYGPWLNSPIFGSIVNHFDKIVLPILVQCIGSFTQISSINIAANNAIKISLLRPITSNFLFLYVSVEFGLKNLRNFGLFTPITWLRESYLQQCNAT